MTSALDAGRRTMRLEAESVAAAAARLDARFERAVELLASGGRVIVSGIGKSGVIAQKIAATLTSTGTAATYLHPIESLHGDLGLVDADSVAIVLSKSGETEELVGLLAELARRAVPLIAIVGGSGLDAGPGGDRGTRWGGGRGGVSTRPGTDHQHYGGPGVG